ncbi:MAG: hypothetical protein F6K11_36205 [Leptolyngbya sp. SIO3F4]|nr:hypothetical protein [Leptolyngbya sp. SIO3F4]
MVPEDYLLVTEITTDYQHKISLERLQCGFVTLGRIAPKEEDGSHIQIGTEANSRDWISAHHCTLLAKENPESPRGWDYFVHDGSLTPDGNWKLSRQGIWVGNKQIDGYLELRPGSGHITLFPKIQNDILMSSYHCILEWPAIKEDGEDTNPTLKEYQQVQMQRRIFQSEAAHAKEQLQLLARNMGDMQTQFSKEREELGFKINDQSTMLLQLSKTLEEERQINRKQEKELAAQKDRNKKVRISIAVLSFIVLAIAAIALRVDQETLKDLLEWSLILVGTVGAILGIKAN